MQQLDDPHKIIKRLIPATLVCFPLLRVSIPAMIRMPNIKRVVRLVTPFYKLLQVQIYNRQVSFHCRHGIYSVVVRIINTIPVPRAESIGNSGICPGA